MAVPVAVLELELVPADVVVPVPSGDVVVVCVAHPVTPGGGQQVRLMQFTVYVFVFRRVSVTVCVAYSVIV